MGVVFGVPGPLGPASSGRLSALASALASASAAVAVVPDAPCTAPIETF
jgi:hypothetical protein